MEITLVDWTRMGNGYCLAGAVLQEGKVRIVRPLLRRRDRPRARQAGWSAFSVDGYSRWEKFELVGAADAAAEPPHLEDIWVRALCSRKVLANVEERHKILAATLLETGQPLFGVPLVTNRLSAYLPPGSGSRSLATIIVPSAQIRFEEVWRAGATHSDVRVCLPIPNVGERVLPVKDHVLLQRSEAAGGTPGKRRNLLNLLIKQMDEQIAVRLGLSRAFLSRAGGPGVCWLMADGFFSFRNPQS